MLTSDHTARETGQKAIEVMDMLKRRIQFMLTQSGVIAISEKLKERRLFLVGVIITWC